MEILSIIGVVIAIFVVTQVIGAIDNNRPVKNWSNDKLYRMHPKLMRVARLSDGEKASKFYRRAEEVEQEIGRREHIKTLERFGDELLALTAQGWTRTKVIEKIKNTFEYISDEKAEEIYKNAKTNLRTAIKAGKIDYEFKGQSRIEINRFLGQIAYTALICHKPDAKIVDVLESMDPMLEVETIKEIVSRMRQLVKEKLESGEINNVGYEVNGLVEKGDDDKEIIKKIKISNPGIPENDIRENIDLVKNFRKELNINLWDQV